MDSGDHGGSDVAARHALVGPADLWEMKRRFQISFLRGVGLLPHHRFLDLGCGTLRGGIPLIDYLERGRYTGVEVRRKVLDEGRRELEESGLSCKEPNLLHCERLDELTLGRQFDIVWAFSVLIHMDDGTLADAVAMVARHLDDGGLFYATVNLGVEPDGVWQGFPLVYRELAFYEGVFRRHGLTVADLGPLTAWGHLHPRLSVADQARQRMLKATRT